jgi:MFS transporter, SP family, solute carrier family 2 (facilitated glucose/fructose transporter), member 5
MATQLAPLFLAEITPFNLRGAFGTANQLFITIGIFVSNLLGLKEIFGIYAIYSTKVSTFRLCIYS